MNQARAQEIVRYVQEHKSFIWDAFEQGQWAHAIGVPRADNPHLLGHSNHWEWTRGWDREEAGK